MKTFAFAVLHILTLTAHGATHPALFTWRQTVDTRWANAANWDLGDVPTDVDGVVFPSSAERLWTVTLDADATVADLFANDVTISGGHALTSHVNGAAEANGVLTRGAIAVSGAGTSLAVSAGPDSPNGRVALGGGSSLAATDGAAMSVTGVDFSDNNGMSLSASGADSQLTFALREGALVLGKNGGNEHLAFVARDGGRVTLAGLEVQVDAGMDLMPAFTADGGTLELSKLNVGCGSLKATCANGGVIRLGLHANTKGASAIACSDRGTIAFGGAVTLPSGSLKPTLSLSGASPSVTCAGAMKLGRDSTSSYLTLNLAPRPDWSETEPRISVVGDLTVLKGVRYFVDVSAFAGFAGTKRMALAATDGALTFAASAFDVAVSGAEAERFSVSVEKDGRAVCLVLAATDGPPSATGQATVTVDATSAAGRVLPNPVSTLTFWGDVALTNYPDFVERAVMFTATGGNADRDLFVDPADETVTDDYDFSRLLTSCRNALASGIRPYLHLGNVPVKFTKGCDPRRAKVGGADGGSYGFNIRPPDDYAAYGAYMKAIANALVAEFGRDEVRGWRFAVLTEANNRHWFEAKDGTAASTKAAFFKLYDHTAKAFTDVLGEDIAIGTHLLGLDSSSETTTFTYRDIIAHCASGANDATGGTGAPLNLLAFSYYLDHPDDDRANPTAGRMTDFATLRDALDAAGFKRAVVCMDEGRVFCTNNGGTKEDELVTRAIGQSWQAAFDVRAAKSAFDHGGDGFASWGHLAGLDSRCDGFPTVSWFTARELAKFAGMRHLPASVSAKLASTKEQVDAIAAVSDDGARVRLALCRFRDKLVFWDRVAASAKLTLPAAMRGRTVTLSALTVDDANNWYTDWLADRTAYGIGASCFGSSQDDQSPLSTLSDMAARTLFAETLEPKYAAKAALVVPTVQALAVPVDGVVTLPFSLVGNSAVFAAIELESVRAGFDAAHTIVCYGDSLTYGVGADQLKVDGRGNYFDGRLAGRTAAGGYPYWLSGLIPTNYNVIAQARSGMCTDLITAWRGGTSVMAARAFVLKSSEPVPVYTNLLFNGTDLGRLALKPNEDDDPPTRDRRSEYGGLIPPSDPLFETPGEDLSLRGVMEGRRVRLTGSQGTNVCLQALDPLPAEGVVVAAGAVFVPDAARIDAYADAIHVFICGANDGAKKAETYLAELEETVRLIPSGRYLVVSPCANTSLTDAEYNGRYTSASATSVERQFAEKFDGRYLNLRTALVARGGRTLFAADGVHLNTRGYQIAAELVKEKLQAIGWLPTDPETAEEIRELVETAKSGEPVLPAAVGPDAVGVGESGASFVCDGLRYAKAHYVFVPSGETLVARIAPEEAAIASAEMGAASGSFLIGTIDETVAGFGYAVEYADELGGDGWKVITSVVPGSGGKLTFEVPLSQSGDRRFYRLVVTDAERAGRMF